MRHLLTLDDVSTAEIEAIFDLSERLRSERAAGRPTPLLAGKVLGLLFNKPSLRTRVSFQAAMAHLGGSSLYLGKEVGWGERESDQDFNRVLTQYVDGIVCRTGDHQIVMRMADESNCPVINGLTNLAHPCQALADLLTLRQLRQGQLAGQKIAYLGDGNNVARSLAQACAHLGTAFVLAAPRTYQFQNSFWQTLRQRFPQADLQMTEDPVEAVRDADVVYTDVWSSMGQEAEQTQRARDLAAFQVNEQIMALAPQTACFMHCLPARRGEEVTDAVIDGPQSVIVQQAANRMHVQKGVLAWLLANP